MNVIRLWAILTALAGVALLAAAFMLKNPSEVTAAGDCWKAKDAKVVAFELARTPEDIEKISKPPNDPCRPKIVASMNAVNMLDVRLFIPAYTTFVVLAALFLAGGT